MSGGYPRTTVSEMELVAAIEALRSLQLGVRVDLYSDSQYLIYGMSSFISNMGTGWLAQPPRLPDPAPATMDRTHVAQCEARSPVGMAERA